jgi:hypothetical protein
MPATSPHAARNRTPPIASSIQKESANVNLFLRKTPRRAPQAWFILAGRPSLAAHVPGRAYLDVAAWCSSPHTEGAHPPGIAAELG